MRADEDKKNYTFNVDESSSGKRIDVFLSYKIPVKSRSYIQKLIKCGGVLINNNPVSKNALLSENDTVCIKNLDAAKIVNTIVPSKMQMDIVYEDSFFLVISKPPGITVHPAPGNYDNTLASAALYYLRNVKKDFSDITRAGIAHRLDKDTSGLIIIAKSDDILVKFYELFKNRQIKKTYVSLVAGNFEEKDGGICLPLGRSRIDRQKISVSSDTGKYSETMFSVLETFKNCTLLNAFPLTGRTHQIRVHFSFIGHPVIGDMKYGNKQSDLIASMTGLKRHFLHAVRLEFKHPVTGKDMDIKDEIAYDLKKILEILRIKI